MNKLGFRQVHLDFHTSPHIPGVGEAFNRKEWQETLKAAAVDSITLFAKCHHGWSYYATRVGKMHPHLKFDLLRAQFDAVKEVGINAPIYISSGVDNVASYEHPEWREVAWTGQYTGWARQVLEPGFHKMCFNSPYMDYLLAQVEEVVRLFPDCDGIFSDIISSFQCCCRWCLEMMDKAGLDPEKEEDRKKASELTLLRYYETFTAACKKHNPKMRVFHNSGHVARGKREILRYFSHLELESLPTGGWGYDHFPISAAYCRQLGMEFVGMTGKFHTMWGEFGGYKHPNALRYECAAMLAHGAHCSIGDQLHPNGRLDPSTYRLIGAAYQEVKTKEPWCEGARSVADIGLLSSEALSGSHGADCPADTGAARILLEGHFLFDVLDAESEFDRYKLLILPDNIIIGKELKAKLAAFLSSGGRLLLSGSSNAADTPDGCAFDCGAVCEGPSPYQPEYILPRPGLRCDFADSPLVMYARGLLLRLKDGESLGDVYEPYFNRTYRHFCSHQHTPYRPEPSGHVLGSRKGNVCWVAHEVFSAYRAFGAVAYKDFLCNLIRELLGEECSARTNLPSTARLTLQEQPAHCRYILHLLYAPIISRGGASKLAGPVGVSRENAVEIIEELLPLRGIEVELKLPAAVKDAVLAPQGIPAQAEIRGEKVLLRIPEFTCHQMVVFNKR